MNAALLDREAIEYAALFILSCVLNSALHHLPDDPGVEEAAGPARRVVGDAQALLAMKADADSRSLAAEILADGFAPLATLGFGPRTLYTFATVGRLATIAEASPWPAPDEAETRAYMRKRLGPSIVDADGVAAALYERWAKGKVARDSAVRPKRKPCVALRDLEAVALWLDALIAELDRIPQSIVKQSLLAACRSMRENLVFWDAKAAMREIVQSLRMYPEGKAVHDRVAASVRKGEA